MFDELMQHGIGGSGGDNIKSIQRGSFLDNKSKNQTVDISEIDLSKSICLIEYDYPRTTMGVSSTQSMLSIDFLNNTQIVIRRASEGSALSSDIRLIHWTVVEFNNVKSLQRGSISSSSSGRIVAITPVNMQKSLIFCSSQGSPSGSMSSAIQAYAVFQDNSNVEIYPKADYYIVNWQIVEFK